MKILVVIGHPGKRSFNHAIAETAIDILQTNRYQVIFHDLYKEKFPSILPAREIPQGATLTKVISKHCEETVQANGIIVIHPNWWGQPPAIVKGWVDRILRPGVAYEFAEGDSGEGVPKGLLMAKTALVFTTSNTPSERELAVFGDPLETLWKNCIFGLCGVQNFYRKNFGVMVSSTLKQREGWLQEVREITHSYFPKIN